MILSPSLPLPLPRVLDPNASPGNLRLRRSTRRRIDGDQSHVGQVPRGRSPRRRRLSLLSCRIPKEPGQGDSEENAEGGNGMLSKIEIFQEYLHTILGNYLLVMCYLCTVYRYFPDSESWSGVPSSTFSFASCFVVLFYGSTVFVCSRVIKVSMGSPCFPRRSCWRDLASVGWSLILGTAWTREIIISISSGTICIVL